ncbi:MAG TPA: Ig-like domain-containing protein [Terriglobales bacterium]|nr:Ig-like domain-containing protein [Terriglobales bacterium]
MPARRRWLLTVSTSVFSISALITTGGCGGSASSAPNKSLRSVSVSPSSATVAVGGTQQFLAIATYSDGSTATVTSQASWTASPQSVAVVSASGLASGDSAGASVVSATFNGVAGDANLQVSPPALKSIAISPSIGAIQVGGTLQFSATGSYSDGSTSDLTSTAAWSTGNSNIASIDAAALATAVSSGTTSVTAALSNVSGNATLTVTAPPPVAQSVFTWHMDGQRTGLNSNEQLLSPANVNKKSFGKLFSYLVDGYLYAEPLLVSNLNINGTVRNVVFVATENDSVFAFDADNYGDGTPLWQVSLLQSGETPITKGPIQPFEGVSSTPVIDPDSNTLYVVSTQAQTTQGTTSFRLNALDLTSGAQKFGGPVTIQAQVPGTNPSGQNGIVTLTTKCIQRAALLLSGGSIYIGFGGCPTGWLLAYDDQSLTQTGVFNSSPNLAGEGQYASAGGVWMGGGGPATDANGYVYITTGNGPWDGQTAWSDSVLKFSNDGKLQLSDYFTPADYHYMDCNDADLASGGLMLIPGSTQALAGGKMGRLYLLDTNNLGHEQDNDAGATQVVPGLLTNEGFNPYSNSCTDSQGTWTAQVNSYELFSTATYFNGFVYTGLTPTATAIPTNIVQLQYSGTLSLSYDSTPALQLGSNGGTSFISANGNSNGVLWLLDHGNPVQNQNQNDPPPSNAILRAYDPADIDNTELYDSSMNSVDMAGYGIKFTSPIVANGKVYIGTAHDLPTVQNPLGELDVYGGK